MELAALFQSMRGRLRQHERTNIFLMVKLTTIFLLAGCLQLSAKSYGQYITLSKKNAPLQEVFIEIYKQSGYYFMCKDNLLDNAKRVDIQVKDATLQEVLEICFKNQPLEYSISDHVIVVSKRESILLDISGKVTNEKGDPLDGAAVLIKGTHKGTQTNAKGIFELKVENNSVELEISFTGYISKTVRVHDGEVLNIQLSLSTNPLDQIQVIAYGTLSQRLNTGNVSAITSETIAEQPVSNPLAAMEGRVAGLLITQNTGVPGGSFTVQIRGRNSISNGNDPLYIIDGVPFTSTPLGSSQSITITGTGNPLNSINPLDIESISILKDADATAIYGSRGANGVVLIVTKKGKAGQTLLNVSAYTGAGKVTRTMPLLNTSQYLQMRHEAFINDGASPDPGVDYDLTSWDTTRYTNWEKTLIGGISAVNDIQASISGGTSNTQFLLGSGYHRETTVYPGSFGDQKGSIHFNLTHASLNQKLKLSFSASYILDENNLFSGDITTQSLLLPPDAPAPFDSNGKLNWGEGNFDNPYSYLQQKFKMQTNNLVSNAVLSYQLFRGLQLKISGGYTDMQLQETETFPLSTFNPAWGLTSGSATFANNSVNTWIVEPQINYQGSLGPGKLSVLIGGTFLQNTSNNQLLAGSGYYNDNLLASLAAASNVSNLNTSYAQYRYAAIFGRINYNIGDRYLMDLTARRDGSSRFGPGKQFNNFGAAGVGWIFSQTEFIKNNLPFVSFGKIRSSYGITGNDQIGDYQYLDLWTPSLYHYQGIQGITPATLLNADFSWETNKKLEVGAEIGFFKDRLLTKVSWYRNRSSNQLVGYPLPAITGFASIQANLQAVVENTGWEIELTTANVKDGEFSWSSAFTLSIPTNRLVAFPNLTSSAYANTLVIGQPTSIVKAFPLIGVNDSTGVYQFRNAKGAPTYDPDFYTDRTSLVNINPVFYGGLQNSIHWKGFQLDFFFQWVKQTGRNYLNGAIFPAPGFFGNQPALVMNRWQASGDQAPVQRFTQSYGSQAYQEYINSAYYGNNSYSDASFIRLKNVSLSYQFPQNVTKKMKLENLRLYIQGQNVLTITHYVGMDPENQSLNNLPPLKIWTAGLQITL